MSRREDIRKFILAKLAEPAAAQRLASNRVAAESLAAVLVDDAAGNFLHAAQAVAAIADGALDPRQPDRFPRGLADFYSLFFSQTFPTDEAFTAARPLLTVLCASREPLTLERLASFTIKSEYETQRELERVAAYFPRRGDHYQVFHQSLRDWLFTQASADVIGSIQSLAIKRLHRRYGPTSSTACQIGSCSHTWRDTLPRRASLSGSQRC